MDSGKAKTMLKDLGAILAQAVERFRQEAGKRTPEDQIAELLSGMRREMVDARAVVGELRDAAERARSELERERRALADCERRREMATRIDDQETVQVAEQFAARHRETISVLEAKLRATEAERDLRARDADVLTARYKEADTRRFALLTELRRAGAEGRIRGAMDTLDEPGGDWDRMAERIDAEAAQAEAHEEVERRLAELKRRAATDRG